MAASHSRAESPCRSDGSPDYVHAVYADVLGWYESAERKAQVILTLDGLLLGFLSASALAEPSELRPIAEQFGWETWVLLGAMVTAMLASLGVALACLWSRIYTPRALDAMLSADKVNKDDVATYGPSVMWFFQAIAHLPEANAKARLIGADVAFAIHALAEQVVRLSPKVRRKHVLVNAGFGLLVLSLILFVAMVASYVVRAT